MSATSLKKRVREKRVQKKYDDDNQRGGNHIDKFFDNADKYPSLRFDMDIITNYIYL